MKKYGIPICIGFIIGFAAAMLLFVWHGDIEWENIAGLGKWFWAKIRFISPYGRKGSGGEKMLYLLHWSTGWSLAGFVVCLGLVFADTNAFFCTKIIISLFYLMATWYLLYAACFLVVKIPVLFKVLGAIAISVIYIVIGFLFLTSISGITEKLDA